MTVKKILSACLALLLLASCNKEITELPAATQTGANTFGAKVDGKMWVPQGLGVFPANNLLEATYNRNTSRLIINARNFSKSPTETGIEFQVAGVNGPGTYLLNTTTARHSGLSYAYFLKNQVTPVDEWMTTSDYTGSITVIKLDEANLIVAGTFQFTALSTYGTPHTISVTEGRFDIKMQ